MTDNDPTQDLIDALERADPKEWGRICYGVPIFRAHKVYEVDDGSGAGTKKLVVVPEGEAAPAGGVCIHTVDRARLLQITEEINRNYAVGSKPAKLFIGHSDPKVPQKLNPEIVGYGRRAYLGKFGKHQIDAIKTDAFFTLGNENAAREYPERSAEFNPRTNAITGVALLKTDPRLPMGMLAFATQDEVLFYGEGFMATPNDAPAAEAAQPPPPQNRDEASVAAHEHSKAAWDAGKVAKQSKLPEHHLQAAEKHTVAGKAHCAACDLHKAAGDDLHAAMHQSSAGLHEANATDHGIKAKYGAPAIAYGEDDMPDETIDNAFPENKPNPDPPAPKAPAGEKAALKPGATLRTEEEPNNTGEKTNDAGEKPQDDAVADGADKPENEGERSPAAGPEAFQPHEIAFADRLMAHLEQNHPAIKHLCGEHKKYMDTQAAMAQPPAPMAAPSATDGYTTANGEPKKPKSDDGEPKKQPKFTARIDMSDQERIDYAETKAKLEASDARIAALEHENAVLYATEAIDDLVLKGKVIKDKPKEIAKLVAMTTLAERQERLEEIKLNYADAERSPARTGGSWIRTDDGHVEGAVTPEPVEAPEAVEIMRYGEENNIDISTDAGIAKATKALIAAKQKAA